MNSFRTHNFNGDKTKQKNMCVYGHMSKKSRVGIIFIIILFFLSAKFGIRHFIFEISVSRHLLKLFYDELRSFSTFFALNFDKKLAVE